MRRNDPETLTEDPTAPPPQRRWTARYGPARRGRPSVVKTVAWWPGGWPVTGNERRYRTHQSCATILTRITAGDRSECPDPVVWRVQTTRAGITRTTYWCDAHLPDTDRPAATLDADASHAHTRP